MHSGSVFLRLLLATFALAGGARAQQAGLFASPAVDPGLYRDGEVKRLVGRFGDWRIACDEVTRLKQRFCSLFGEGRTGSGQTVASLTVSTADDGRPAALLRLPFGVRLSRGVEIAANSPGAGGGKTKPEPRLRLRFLRCDATGCMTLAPLTDRQIAALNGGGGLSLRFAYAPTPSAWPRLQPPATDLDVEARIDGAGFRDAVAASMR